MILQGGTVYQQGSFIRADLRIDGNFIKEINSRLLPKANEEVIHCKGLHILPGLIDIHVHFREPGAVHKEDFLSGSKAAAAGGVTTVFDMPNNTPPVVTQKDLNAKRKLAKKSLVNYGLYVLGCRENRTMVGNFIATPGIKVYLGSSTGNYLTDDLGVFADILQHAKRPVVVHAENEQLIRYFSEKYKKTEHHHKMRDNLCAAVSVAESTTMASYFQKQLHLAHVSTAEEIDIIRKHKTSLITAEVSPHHLFLTEQFFLKQKNYGKMNPPLRYQKDQDALWQALHDGVIDIIATDHAPHTHDEKKKSCAEAPCGVPGVQTMLSLLLEAVHQKKLKLVDVVRYCCNNPARIFGIQKRGNISPGYFADLCIIDLNRTSIIRNQDQYSKCGWTPFDGIPVHGAVQMTFVNGTKVFDQGKFFPSSAKEVTLI
ncbi:dihydroorotase [Candidatus Woesearchaeota archaeon]|nr:dihydroorotase [Candidatus Woesearchaeota archaeon]